MDDYALVINARSSGLRFCMYRRPDIGPWQLDARGGVEAIGDGRSALEAVAEWVRSTYEGDHVLGIGHRVAHVGARFAAPVLVTPFVLDELRMLERLAAFHHTYSLAALEGMAGLLPGVPQVACFDTSFHSRRHTVSGPTPLSREHREAGLRRFGFHGLSYEHITSVLPQVAPDIADRRVIVAHLDDDSSVCAITNRRSIDALGMSGITDNVLQLLDLGDPDAHRAVDNFVYSVARGIAVLVAESDGIDALVFTGAIGETSAEIRSRICDRVAWLGIEVDEHANLAGGPRISQAAGQVSAWMIPTNEELVVARHTAMLLGLVETHA
jgi:acetate kinase